MQTQEIQAVIEETERGELIFPEVVRRLCAAGVESYFVDLAAAVETFYLHDGQTHSEKMTLVVAPVADRFSPPEVISAIRGAQADTIRYPEFLGRSTAAGVIGYWAFLAGKKVIYFGRRGEMHVEEFSGRVPRGISLGRPLRRAGTGTGLPSAAPLPENIQGHQNISEEFRSDKEVIPFRRRCRPQRF